MEYRHKLLDAVAVERATDSARYIADESVKHALEFVTDPRQLQRLEAVECKTCFYFRSGRIGGAAMTTSNCRVCDKEMGFGSTNVDYLCKECGFLHELCIRCGGDIHMRPRRIFDGKPHDNKKLKALVTKARKLTKGMSLQDLDEPLDTGNE